MSALDRALIKAYAKHQPAISPERRAAARSTSAATNEEASTANRALAVEQIYHKGSLYRLETPVDGQRYESETPSSPGLHLPPTSPRLPPTSPRRGIRRSLLRFLAGQNVGNAATEAPSDTPPRVARKVIIRHIAHQSLPGPRGLLRPGATGSDAQDGERFANGRLPGLPERVEMPTDTIGAGASAGDLTPDTPPPIAANEALILGSYIAELKDWDAIATPAMMVVSESAELARGVSEALVSVRLDPLLSPEDTSRLPQQGGHRNQAADAVRFAGKSLDDTDVLPPRLHIDPPHAQAGPHIRFPASTADGLEVPASVAEGFALAPAPVEELALADLHEEPLASDLIPPVGAEDNSDRIRGPAKNVDEIAKPTVPLWEVDRFQWPKTCQKLLNDESGYFARAGEKLLAAVRDGLRVLAITGSRRGEGRTTLALCLAHTAAKTGIHVAIMEGDFARPQLASKLGLDVAFGWQDAAIGRISLSEAAVKSLADGITALPLEPSAARQALSLADPRITATIRAAAATFELLILDLGPLNAGEELRFPLGESCPLDAAIVVRDARFATVVESEAIGHKLQDIGVEAVGIAENFVVEEELKG